MPKKDKPNPNDLTNLAKSAATHGKKSPVQEVRPVKEKAEREPQTALNVQVPVEIYKALKIQAVKDDTTLRETVLTGLREFLASKE